MKTDTESTEESVTEQEEILSSIVMVQQVSNSMNFSLCWYSTSAIALSVSMYSNAYVLQLLWILDRDTRCRA